MAVFGREKFTSGRFSRRMGHTLEKENWKEGGDLLRGGSLWPAVEKGVNLLVWESKRKKKVQYQNPLGSSQTEGGEVQKGERGEQGRSQFVLEDRENDIQIIDPPGQ